MIIEFNRITKDGRRVPCSIPAEDISAIEISDRDGETTVIRTERGVICIEETYAVAVAMWRRGRGEVSI